MANPVLDYAGETEPDRLAIDELPDGGVTITVPTRRSFGRWIGSFVDVWTIIFLPVLWLVYTLRRTRAPRAVLRLTNHELVVTEASDESLGRTITARSWPRGAIGELRANPYENSLHLRVPGSEMTELLEDVPRSEIEAIAGALNEAMRRLDERRTPLGNEGVGRQGVC